MMRLAGLMSRLVLCLLLGGVLSGDAEAWMYTEGQGGIQHVASSVALDGAGSVIVAGNAHPEGGTELRVVKLDGMTGTVLWRWVEFSESPMNSRAEEVAVDPAGDILVGATFFVVKLAGTDGTELWRRGVGGGSLFVDAAGDAYAGSGGVVKLSGADGTTVWNAPGEEPRGIAVDANGDVFAGAGPNGNLTKLDGSSGAQLWQTYVSFDGGDTIAVDGAGDVIAGDYKLSGTDGTLLWMTFNARATAVDSAGDVFMAFGGIYNQTFVTYKLSGVDGTTIWARTIPGNGNSEIVSVNAADDVVVAGNLSTSLFLDPNIVVAKYRGADGTQLWRRDIAGRPNEGDGPTDLVITAEDDAIVAGGLAGTAARLLVAKMTGPSPGTKLLVRDKDGDPTRRRLLMTARDPALLIAPPGSPGDPTIGGATLELVNPTTGETGTMMLPAEHWEGRGDPPGTKSYQYRDAPQTAGPCRKVNLNSRKSFKIDCKGADIPFTLDELAGQGELQVRLVTGTETLRHCVAFGGDIKRDVPAVAGGSGLFKALDAAPPSSCGEELGSPAAAFLDAAESLLGW